jgi:uncharacterized protein with gpF-like domain
MLSKDNILYLLTLPPEEIVSWYENKGFRFSWTWQDTWQAAHTRSFTVAKGMRLDILQTIKNEVDNIFKKGITYQQFYNNLESTLKRLGWWGKVKAKDVPGYVPRAGLDPDKIVQLGSPNRLKTIYEVNANVAYNAGRYNFYIQNAEDRPYWKYRQIERPTYRKEHRPFADKIFRFDDPIWKIIMPPNGWRCGCYITAHDLDEVRSMGLKISKGKDFRKYIDKGIPEEWQYNPAKEYSTWQPDPSKYDPDIRANL